MNPLPAVITMIPHQKEIVERMARYCEWLDGTKLNIIEVSDEGFITPYLDNIFACKQGHSFRAAALEMKGQDFIWIEPDGPPVKKGWAKTLSDEQQAAGKPFVMTSDRNLPYDFTGGCAVMSGDSWCLIPQDFPKDGWDRWLYFNLPEAVHYTPILQHSYGIYDRRGDVSVRRFPNGLNDPFIRPEAVMFHRDKFQDLIPSSI